MGTSVLDYASSDQVLVTVPYDIPWLSLLMKNTLVYSNI